MPRIKEMIAEASQVLQGICENPQKEVRTMLSHALGKELLWIMAHDDDTIETPQDFLDHIEQRKKSVPLEYILKQASFYSREFYVDERVLIPRPETELLVDHVLGWVKEHQSLTIAEIGTGSGIISIMLAHFLPQARLIAVDLSKEALEVAQINAIKHGVSQNITFVHGHLLDDVNVPIDVLVSNPPYIKKDAILDKNLSYEPSLALFGGEEGDEILKEIIDIAHKRKIALLACEMGYDQREKITNYLHTLNAKATFYKDYSDFDRGFLLEG
ncbi:peptide chain release factor N(5)-glutamine methyltransferase [Sulfurospirillum sp. 1612]|uniref:peptide chain release factor N(5)-glutamine methyltransferase n=1 Tax=Sulfurospirillum sp. 1612 TaxID=3094835 RepID=UPI002F92CD8B